VLTLGAKLAHASQEGGAINGHDVIGEAELDEEILTFDIPDEL
jgi:hypothetical protein